MNTLNAKIVKISNVDNLNIVVFDSCSETLSMMSLDLDNSLKVGTKVKLAVKSSHLAIAKDFDGMLSYSNQLKCLIKSVNNGQLLSSIHLDFCGIILEALITKNSSLRMNLQVGDSVTALIKASELSISEIIDD